MPSVFSACLELPGSTPRKFRGDAFRYQKEAKTYYLNPVTSLITEFMQNSIDACSKVGPPAEMKMDCHVSEQKLPIKLRQGNGKIVELSQNRVIVHFEDNGSGMDEEVVEKGLLQIGADQSTREDKGRKSDLGSSAGGFGLAKVLLFLAQDGFTVFTKMKQEEKVLIVTGKPNREDQEQISCVTTADRQMVPAKFFRPGDDSHGTLIQVVLNPFVMAMHPDRVSTSDVYKFIKDEAYLHATAYDYVTAFKAVFSRSHLPGALTLNGETMVMASDPGEFKTHVDIYTNRTCASIFAKEGDNDRMPVVLQVLRGKEPGPLPYFLFLFESPVRAAGFLPQQATLVLLSTDQNSEPFKPADLLDGSRSHLSASVSNNAMPKVMQFLRDPSTIPPPAKLSQLTLSHSNGLKSFGSYFDEESKVQLTSRSYDWFANLTKADVDTMFGGPWRKQFQYHIFLNQEEGMQDSSIKKEIREVDLLTAADVAHLELYGALVHQALEVMESSLAFEVGFFASKNAEGARRDRAGEGEASERPLYLYNPLKGDRLPEGRFDSQSVWRAVIHLRCLAHHEVSHSWFKEHDGQFYKKMEEVRNAVDYFEQEGSWTWYHMYRRIMTWCFLRGVQDGFKDEAMLAHIFSLQAKSSELAEGVDLMHKEDVKRELANVQVLAESGSGDVAPSRSDDGRISIQDKFSQVKAALQEQHDEKAKLKEKLDKLEKEMAARKKWWWQ